MTAEGESAMDIAALAATAAVFLAALIGIFRTKTAGWGRYTTSLMILALVLFVAALGFLREQIGPAPLLNLLFAIAGYAGGLIGGGREVGGSQTSGGNQR